MKFNIIFAFKVFFFFGMTIFLVRCNNENTSELINLHPNVNITNPADCSVIFKSDSVAITVEATDTDGTLEQVIFFINGEERFSDNESPFIYNWDTSDENLGTCSIEAKAIDNDGDSWTSEISIELRYSYVYTKPENVGDGWETASLGSVGMDTSLIVALMNKLHNHQNHRVHGVLIARHGLLVLEEYFDGYRRDDQNILIHFDRGTRHDLASATKSFTSALLGIAIDHGFISGVEQPVVEFFPEFEWMGSGTKAEITLEHMITMSSGLQWDQTSYPPLDPRNDLIKFALSSNPWYFYLSRPLDQIPGTAMNYSEASINVVGECIRRSSGLRLDQFADEYLFNPLGIVDRRWNVKWDDWVWASGDLFLRPRDMLKFGQLYLQGGVWEGEQIVPEEWVDRASVPYFFTFDDSFQALNRPFAIAHGMSGYSYAWWTLNVTTYGDNAFTASGWGEQYIMVLPELDMVAVFTGGSQWEDPLMTAHEMMLIYILRSIQ